MEKILKDIENNTKFDNIVRIIGPDDIFTIDKPFVVTSCINNNKQLAVIAFVDNFKENDYSLRPTNDLYKLMKNEKVNVVIGKKILFYTH